MAFPPRAPPDLRIFERATWPQITAGIAVKSHPHVNERTARMRLQIATAEVRGTVCGTAVGEGGGGVSSAIATVVADFMREHKTRRMMKGRQTSTLAKGGRKVRDSRGWLRQVAAATAPRNELSNVLLIDSQIPFALLLPFGLPVYLARLPSARFSSACDRARVVACEKQNAR